MPYWAMQAAKQLLQPGAVPIQYDRTWNEVHLRS
jgi:hypothetical protein